MVAEQRELEDVEDETVREWLLAFQAIVGEGIRDPHPAEIWRLRRRWGDAVTSKAVLNAAVWANNHGGQYSLEAAARLVAQRLQVAPRTELDTSGGAAHTLSQATAAAGPLLAEADQQPDINGEASVSEAARSSTEPGSSEQARQPPDTAIAGKAAGDVDVIHMPRGRSKGRQIRRTSK